MSGPDVPKSAEARIRPARGPRLACAAAALLIASPLLASPGAAQDRRGPAGAAERTDRNPGPNAPTPVARTAQPLRGGSNPETASALAQSLLSNVDRKQLATEVEGLLRKGDASSAELLVLNAVDTDALVGFVIGQLLDPGLLNQLQAQGLYSPDRTASTLAAASDAPADSVGVPAPAPQGAPQSASQTSPLPEPADALPAKTGSLNPPAAPVPSPPQTAAPPAPSAESLVTRADLLLKSGDVSGARLLLERALEAGNPRAAFLLAESYDPRVLARLGVLGLPGDAAKARELYARAASGGIPQASERMQTMR